MKFKVKVIQEYNEMMWHYAANSPDISLYSTDFMTSLCIFMNRINVS